MTSLIIGGRVGDMTKKKDNKTHYVSYMIHTWKMIGIHLFLSTAHKRKTGKSHNWLDWSLEWMMLSVSTKAVNIARRISIE